MSTLTFTVPGNPVGKGRPRIGKIGAHSRMFTPEATVSYENHVKHCAHLAMAGAALMTGPVSVRMFLGCPIPASWSQKKQLAAEAGTTLPTTKPDADNVIKAVFDAINGIVWTDDVQVVDLTVRKRYSRSPCVKAWIEPLATTPTEQPQPEKATA